MVYAPEQAYRVRLSMVVPARMSTQLAQVKPPRQEGTERIGMGWN